MAAAGQLPGGLIAVAPLALVFGGPVVLSQVSVWAWLAIVLSGTIGLGASFVLFLGMVERHGPTAALLALYVMPVVVTLLGAGLLGEVVTAPMLVGSAGAGAGDPVHASVTRAVHDRPVSYRAGGT